MNSPLLTGSFKTVDRTKVSDQISAQLLKRIVSGEYAPGTRLPSEREIAELTGVSRVAVREAIGSLVTRGIVSVKQGRGTIVNPIDEWKTLDPTTMLLIYGENAILHLMEFRMLLEPEIAALAAERITPEEIEELRKISELPEDDIINQHAQRDTAFHLHITRVSDNPVLLMVMTSVQDLMNFNRRQAFIVPGALAQARHWHRKIFEAIADHDSQAARQAMIEHINQVLDALDIEINTRYKS
ncbi:MAG: FadR family transcriptional regulator [Chloroflexi bacterium]|nr:FadR family transcriptional regulator [Chloroflexota bacterium]